MGYEFDWVDAFADRKFAGNACVVVHDAGDISIDDRLRLVRETSLSECAFLVPSDKADFGVRYYVADNEILLAGHPTIATVQSLILRGLVALGDKFTLEVGAGVLPIEVDLDGTITMEQAAPEFGDSYAPEEMAPLYGLKPDDILGRPRTVSTGTAYPIILLRDKTALKKAKLNVRALEDFRSKTDADWGEPFLTTIGGETVAGDTFSRLLMVPPLPAEDPFTGSATGCMAAYLWSEGFIKAPEFIAEQGHWMGRPGKASIEVLGSRDAIKGVRVGGRGVVLMSGELHI